LNEDQVQASALQLGYNTNLALGKTDNTTGYTGTAPLWTGTILKGEKIVIKGKATSTGANIWNSPLAYLWSGETAEVNFRQDNWINAAAQEKQESQNFAFTKVWKGFDPESANGDDWVAALNAKWKSGECDATITWDYTDATKIVVTYSWAWEDATFNQSYEIKAIEGSLLDTYKIGIGVDSAHLTATSCEYTYAAPAQA